MTKLPTIDKRINPVLVEATTAETSLYSDYSLRPYNPSELYQKRGNYDLYDEMREDDQISGLFHLKKLLTIDNKWEIVCDNKKIKKFIEDNLLQIPEGMDKKFYGILSALDYGFSLTEKIFKIKNGKIWLKDLKTRPPHGFKFIQNKYGKVMWIEQDTGEKYTNIAPSKFIHYVNQKEFDNPYGKSELNKGVYTLYWSKTIIRKFWNIFLERFGMPTAVGTYNASMESQKDNIKKAIDNLQSKTSIVVPEGVVLQLLEAKSEGGDQYEKAINHLDMKIARKMLVPDLIGMGGSETGGGSFALGKEQFGVFYIVIEQIRDEIERIINEQIIQPLVHWNFGDHEVYFQFQRVDDLKRAEHMKIWLEWVKMGGAVSDEAIEWFHEQIEVPAPDMDKVREEESKEQPEEQEDEPVEDQQEGEQPKDQEKGESKEPDTEEKNKKDKMSFFDKIKSLLKFNKDEKKNDPEQINFERNENDFLFIENTYRPLIEEQLRNASNFLIDKLSKSRIVQDKDFRAVNNLNLNKNKKEFQLVIEKMLKDAYNRGKASLEEYKLALEQDEIASWLEQYAFYVASAESENILTKAKPIIADGIRQGSSLNQVLKELKQALNDVPKYRLENVVRTTTSKAYNEARMQGFESQGDRITGYKYVPILDDRTSDICKFLDSDANGIYKPDEARLIMPPNHFQCRSIMVPLYESVDEYTTVPDNLQKEGDFYKINK